MPKPLFSAAGVVKTVAWREPPVSASRIMTPVFAHGLLFD